MTEYLQNYQQSVVGNLYSSIKYYYPIIDEESGSTFDDEENKTDRRKNVISISLQNLNEYKLWLNFLEDLTRNGIERLRNLNLKQQPSYNGEIIISSWLKNDVENSLSLLFSVSLLGPFYSIIGVENLKIPRNSEEEQYNTSFNGQIMAFASPTKLLNPSYEILKGRIEKNFKGYKHVPYNILNLKVKGLNSSNDTVYKAMFDGPFRFPNSVLGVKYYPWEDWKNDTNLNSWKLGPSDF